MPLIALLLALAAPQLPEPFETPWNRAIPTVVERPAGARPTVPPGFEVGVFAEGLRRPRRMALAPNGDVFVAQSAGGEIVVLRDADGDGVAELRETFATGLERPFGLAFRPGFLYVGENDAVVRFPWVPGQLRAGGDPERLVELPVSSDALDHDTAERLGIDVGRTRGFNHWTRNLAFSPDGGTLYVAVGSATNATPGTDPRRAAINAYAPDGSQHRVHASGLRNPVPLAFEPVTGTLWTAVNERDHLGDDLAPDYVTSVAEGGFYGWPYAYIGPHPEPILGGARPDLVERTIVPDVLLPAHAAPLGMTFYTGEQFPAAYRNSAFVALHGSINRRDLTGYTVVRIPFADGRPAGPPEDFLGGFVLRDDDRKEVWARPVDVLQAADGTLLVSDDAGNRIFRVRHVADTLPTGFTVVESNVLDLQAAMAAGTVTSRDVVTAYLTRIALYEDRLNAAVSVNARALEEAAALDAERAAGRVRGPLHGIPVALKDNIHTTHLPTTGGALAFAGYVPPYEATLTRNLREAGAIIIAKAGLTEFANFMAGSPNPMPGNYNALTGFGFNPFDPRRDPRPDRFDGRPVLSTGGSSSGIGTSASFWQANVGTDTGGSVISPSNATMLVGIRPTLGRVSRWGIAPVTLDHDMAGPMARNVTDAALLLGAMEGDGHDPNDDATGVCEPVNDYTPHLRADGLRGARIGIPRAWYYDPITLEGRETGGLDAEAAALMEDAIDALRAAGAVIVDPADVPSLTDPDPDANFAAWDLCVGGEQAKGHDEGCSVNFKYGMKRDFDAWLATLGPSAPVHSLTELREWNLAHREAGAMKYEQSRFDISDEMDLVADRARNEADVAKDRRLSRTRGIDAVLEAHDLDAILTPGSQGAGLAARAGTPIIVVPFGFVANDGGPPFPAGFEPEPAPFGVGFNGAACSEPRLVEIAYAFEQATRRRVAPPLFR